MLLLFGAILNHRWSKHLTSISRTTSCEITRFVRNYPLFWFSKTIATFRCKSKSGWDILDFYRSTSLLELLEIFTQESNLSSMMTTMASNCHFLHMFKKYWMLARNISLEVIRECCYFSGDLKFNLSLLTSDGLNDILFLLQNYCIPGQQT